MPPSNPPWWRDPQRRQLIRCLLRQQQTHGVRLTWQDTPTGVQLFVNDAYDSTITLRELQDLEQRFLRHLAEKEHRQR